ncbi:MAG TPA: hypothetical protein VLB00_15450, partial [Gemmatimonadales bacterium]|nr:hypothetical protein [Gemmatimonadales bacterium]
MRERVLLFGEVSHRPEGLERALVRAGFALAEGSAASAGTTPDLALLAVRDGGAALETALATFAGPCWAGVPVVVLLSAP